MECPYCKGINKNDAKFCVNCGHLLTVSNEDSDQIDISSYYNNERDTNISQNSPSKPPRKIKKWQIIVLIVSAVLLLGLIVYIIDPDYGKKKPTESSLSSESTDASTVERSTVNSRSENSLQESHSIVESKPESHAEVSKEPILRDYNYVINTESRIAHPYNCSAEKKIKAENRMEITVQAYSQSEANSQIIAKGYEICGICSRY